MEGVHFPEEIAALLICANGEFFMFYITYYFDRQKLKGVDDYQALGTPIKRIIAVLGCNATVFVEGGEKAKEVKRWLKPDDDDDDDESIGSIRVEEVSGEPGIDTLDSLYPNVSSITACLRHLTNGASHCALHRAYLIYELLDSKYQHEGER